MTISSVITFHGFLDTHLLIPIIALYAYELGASVGITGLIIGLYSLTNTPANILFGRLIDRIGYRVPLIVGLIGDALSMFCYSTGWVGGIMGAELGLVLSVGIIVLTLVIALTALRRI